MNFIQSPDVVHESLIIQLVKTQLILKFLKLIVLQDFVQDDTIHVAVPHTSTPSDEVKGNVSMLLG